MDRIDFRSDTVTWPTLAMRQAMASAELGDDVYGEDPTVNALERTAAEILGKEAGLFVASGTMGNLTAILSHAQRGDEAIVGVDGHVFRSEAGGMATLGSVTPRPLPTDERGRMDLADVRQAIRGDDPHWPRSRLILVENSYGQRGGRVMPLDYLQGIRAIADEYGLAVHMDGARLFNAAVAANTPPATLAATADSVSICLSKGLCAPVGSVLCGDGAFIHRARRVRKALGGGMRQAGVLAAAGVVALDEMRHRLAEDHALACRLAEGLAALPGVEVDPATVETNIVFFSLAGDVPLAPADISRQLREQANIWVNPNGPRRFRAVTHYWVGAADVDALLSNLTAILS